jgi:hypothetical protein
MIDSTWASPVLLHTVFIQETTQEVGAYVVTGARDKLIMLWEAQSGRHVKTLVSLCLSAVTNRIDHNDPDWA